jgi:hypothetical protein
MLEEYFKVQKKETVDKKESSGFVHISFAERKQILSYVLDPK